MQEMKPIKEGKVREIYDNGDSLIMVATDRISCFDVILKNIVTKKGTVLTQMSKFWFDMTEDILPNHMISVDVKDMPEFFQQEKFDGNSMMCKKLEMLPVECIVRGYITGSGWASYKENGISSRNRSIHLPQRQRSEIMMRISHTSRVLNIWKRDFLARAKNMAQSFVTIQSLYIRSVQNMHYQEVSS